MDDLSLLMSRYNYIAFTTVQPSKTAPTDSLYRENRSKNDTSTQKSEYVSYLTQKSDALRVF
jgi:hypothetical protein